MNIATRVDQTVNQLKRVLDVELSAEQERKVRQAVQIALNDTIHEIYHSSSQVINVCCSADQDLAHKLNQEIELAKQAVITNLSSLR